MGSSGRRSLRQEPKAAAVGGGNLPPLGSKVGESVSVLVLAA